MDVNLVLEELSVDELLNIDGGWNLLEYCAYGVGYIQKKLDGAGGSTSAYTDGSFMFY